MDLFWELDFSDRFYSESFLTDSQNKAGVYIKVLCSTYWAKEQKESPEYL